MKTVLHRLQDKKDSSEMLKTEDGSQVCFTQPSYIAYQCPDACHSKPDLRRVMSTLIRQLTREDYLNVYFTNDSIEFLTKSEEKVYKTFEKLKKSKLKSYVTTVKNAANHEIVRLKLQTLNSSFGYNTFINASTINNKLNSLVFNKITPHIGLMYFARFIESAEIAVLFSEKEEQLEGEVYGLQCLEDVGNETAAFTLNKWINMLKDKQGRKSKSFEETKMKFDQFLRSLLFRVLFTLCAIQTVHPSFRHNDLHLENLIMSEFAKKSGFCSYITQDGEIFVLENSLGNVSIIDFGWSSLEGVQNLGLNMGPNLYVDVNKLFNHLYLMLHKHAYFVNPQVWKFITGCVPPLYRIGLKASKNVESATNMSIWSPHSEFMILYEEQRFINPNSNEIGKPLPNFVSSHILLKDPIFHIFKSKEKVDEIFTIPKK